MNKDRLEDCKRIARDVIEVSGTFIPDYLLIVEMVEQDFAESGRTRTDKKVEKMVEKVERLVENATVTITFPDDV